MGVTLFKMTAGCIELEKYKIISLDTVPSTQTYAHDLINQGDIVTPCVVTAKSQTAGRGRYSRVWVSNSGNLYASFIWQCAQPDPRLSYAVAVAVAETLIKFGVPARIKWPNDILADGKKICGILIEYHNKLVVAGIGINIQSNPDGVGYETARVAQYVDGVSPDDVMGPLIDALDKWRGADFESVRARWMELATGINKSVTYRGVGAELIGIDENGALVLRRDGQNFLAWGDEIII